MPFWQCIRYALNVSLCVSLSVCGGHVFWQTAVGVLHSSLQLHLLLFTDKKSPEHPERMRRYREAAELFEDKVSPKRRVVGEQKRKTVIISTEIEGIMSCSVLLLGEQ